MVFDIPHRIPPTARFAIGEKVRYLGDRCGDESAPEGVLRDVMIDELDQLIYVVEVQGWRERIRCLASELERADS